MKQLAAMYPAYIAEHSDTLTEAEKDSYKKQYTIVKKLNKLFSQEGGEQPTQNSLPALPALTAHAVGCRSDNFEKVSTLMQVGRGAVLLCVCVFWEVGVVGWYERLYLCLCRLQRVDRTSLPDRSQLIRPTNRR